MAMLSTTSLPATSMPVLPEAALHVTGAARLVLVINLGSFVVAPDADAFRHLRGSEAFAAALRKLRPSAPFGIDEAHQHGRARCLCAADLQITAAV